VFPAWVAWAAEAIGVAVVGKIVDDISNPKPKWWEKGHKKKKKKWKKKRASKPLDF
jgi:hypothetical protein